MSISISFNSDGTLSIAQGEYQKSQRSYKGNSLLTSIRDFVVIDIETTGLSPSYDEIIELAAIRYRDGNMVKQFSSLVKPRFPVDDFITQITGISNKMLESAPVLKDILPRFLDFIGKDILLGHNIHFDINFIYDSCERLCLPHFSNDFIDTLRISRRMYKELEHHRLDDLIALFGLEARTLHRGLGDCELTAKCYFAMTADNEHFEEAMKAVKKNYGNKSHFSAKEIVAEEGFQNPDSPLWKKVCVFTGALESFTRKEAAQLVANIGGICEDNITKRTNYLILGNNDYCKSIKDGKSSKQKKAEKLIANGADLSIIPESVFLDMLQSE